MRIAAGTRAARILTAQPHCGPGLDPLEQSPENRTTHFLCMVYRIFEIYYCSKESGVHCKSIKWGVTKRILQNNLMIFFFFFFIMEHFFLTTNMAWVPFKDTYF